jgi:DNA (cytosine-5)-methyltransferase 1
MEIVGSANAECSGRQWWRDIDRKDQTREASAFAGLGEDMANSNSMRELQQEGSQPDQWGRTCDSGENMADSHSAQCKGRRLCIRTRAQYADYRGSSWWDSEPNVGRVANGVAARVDRLKAIGNGQVPLCAATAWNILTNHLAKKYGQQ